MNCAERASASPKSVYCPLVRCAHDGLRSCFETPTSEAQCVVVYIPMVIRNKRTPMGAAQDASYDDSEHFDACSVPVRRVFNAEE